MPLKNHKIWRVTTLNKISAKLIFLSFCSHSVAARDKVLLQITVELVCKFCKRHNMSPNFLPLRIFILQCSVPRFLWLFSVSVCRRPSQPGSRFWQFITAAVAFFFDCAHNTKPCFISLNRFATWLHLQKCRKCISTWKKNKTYPETFF